ARAVLPAAARQPAQCRSAGCRQPAALARADRDRRGQGHLDRRGEARPCRFRRDPADRPRRARRPLGARCRRPGRAQVGLRPHPADALMQLRGEGSSPLHTSSRHSGPAMTLAATTADRSRKRPFWSMERQDWLMGYLFIAPQLAGIVLFVLIPLGLVVWYS